VLTTVIYGAKVEFIDYAQPLSWGRMKSTIKKDKNIVDAPNGYNSAVLG